MDNDANMISLALNDTFRFACSERVSCFNECCRDLNQYLTPYDILRLKNRLDLPSGLFLERYTRQHTGTESGLPIITLKADHSKELQCPFATQTGCSVYQDRPSSCRAYPLMRVLSRSRETGRMKAQYLLLKEPHCLGFQQEQTQTVAEWIQIQGLTIYNQMNDMMMEIISLKNRLVPGRLDIKASLAFHMACYDLDKFRAHLFEKEHWKAPDLAAGTLEAAKHKDEALLLLGLQWLKQHLFGKI